MLDQGLECHKNNGRAPERVENVIIQTYSNIDATRTRCSAWVSEDVEGEDEDGMDMDIAEAHANAEAQRAAQALAAADAEAERQQDLDQEHLAETESDETGALDDGNEIYVGIRHCAILGDSGDAGEASSKETDIYGNGPMLAKTTRLLVYKRTRRPVC